MESSHDDDDEAASSKTSNLKRKRPSSSISSDENNSTSDQGEYELFTKYFVSTLEKHKGRICRGSADKGTPLQLSEAQPSRKRKFLYPSDDNAPKRFRKFYYLSNNMTKPRKLRIRKPVESEEKKPEQFGKKVKLHFARSDRYGNVNLMHRNYLKSDLFFTDEKKCNYEASKKEDLSFHIVDEIALEGLDGITLEAFWKRLKYVFPNYISKTVADRIWRIICNNKHINFYILTEPREQLISFDRCKYMDIDSGVFVEPFIEFKDIYPLASVNGTEIRGSCSSFESRKENNGVRKFSLQKTIRLYNQRLVCVADQVLRNKALISEEADPNLELQDLEYCMLERIGRSRDQGELTQGKMALNSTLNDNKSVYHNRKLLSQNFLIVNQFFYVKSLASLQNISGGLVHLSRFYNKRKTKQVVIMEQVANLLRDRPNYQIELQEFRKLFGRSRSMIRLVKTADFRRFFKIYTFPYRKLYPNATKHEYLSKNGYKERQVKILRMIDPLANVTAILESKDVKEEQHETIKSEAPGQKLINYEYLRDIFLYIFSTGKIGATVQEIHDYFKTDFYSVRLAIRKLLLRNVIESNKIDLGRQQSMKFYAKCFNNAECCVDIDTKIYELSEETVARVLKGYEEKTDLASAEIYAEPKSCTEVLPPESHFSLSFKPFGCTAFITETVDDISEELTMYDIVIKGRDKLLLLESNLFADYLSEWDDLLLKRDDFSKTTIFFQIGFGKVIYDYLKELRLCENLEIDNRIIFDINTVALDTKVTKQLHEVRIIEIVKNFSNPHSDNYHVDELSKMYLFQAMFNENHSNSRTLDTLKNIFEQIMISEGLKKRENVPRVKVEPTLQVEVTNNVAMEKYMGPNPVLKLSEMGEDGIKTEVYASTEPEKFVENRTMYTSSDVSLTQRYINRANLILNIVYEQTILRDVSTIFKDIRKKEDEEGYDKKVCKKSVNSIILKLVTEGFIKIFKVIMIGKDALTRTQTFVCLPFVDVEHGFIRSTIDQLKLKFYVGTQQNHNKTIRVKKKVESPFNINDVRESIIELKQLTTNKADITYKFNKNIGKVYGYSPKCVRMRVLHEFLFYIIRELTPKEQLTNRDIFEFCKNSKVKLTSEEIILMPPVYCNEVSWKMFIHALPVHNNFPKGWALACDIILRMPLSVFVKLYNVSYEIPEIVSYLKHPIKRHYLLKQLPVSVRNVILLKRKYFHNIYEIISRLCFMGLLQLGPRNFKEKDQLFLYLNCKATLYDTCTSKPGYNKVEDRKYKKITFEFKSGNDVELYWSEMLRICINTPLGKRKILDGQCVTIEDCNCKPEMIETLKAKTFASAIENDQGKVPGDRRGAAGFDSSLWTFVKKNWIWYSQTDSKVNSNIQSQVTGLKKEKLNAVLPQPIQHDLLAKGVAAERKVYLKPVKSVKKPISRVQSVVVKALSSKKSCVRKIVARRTQRVREYYDEIDKSIMKQNTQTRVEWDDEEYQILRYCRAALVFLCPIFKKQSIPYNVIRDVLHSLYPKSKNKTSRAVQRRMYLLLMSDEIMKIMENNVENFLNSDTISKYFDQIHNRHKYGLKITDSQMHISFIYLMSYIYKHRKEVELLLLGYIATVDFFSDAYIPLFEVILDNVESESNTSHYFNPQKVEDITKDTIKSVILCSLSCKKNSIGWSFQLFQIYKKFCDDLIRVAVTEMKRGQFMVLNKNYEDNKTVANNWHIPLKFSVLYNLMKSSTYSIAMYTEAYKNFRDCLITKRESGSVKSSNFISYNELNSFWEKTVFVFEIPEMGIILNPEIDDHSEVIEELAKRFRLYLVKIHGTKHKNQDVLLGSQDKQKETEKDIEEIKSDVRQLIFRVPYLLEGNLELYFKLMWESTDVLEINQFIRLMIVELKSFAQLHSSLEGIKEFVDEIQEDTDSNDQKKLMKNLSKVVFAIQNIGLENTSETETSLDGRFKQWESEQLNEITSDENNEVGMYMSRFNKNYTSAMENCIKRAREGDFPSLDEIKEGIMAEGEDSELRKFPHITDLIMLLTEGRFPELDTDNDTIEKMKQHFIMQYPMLEDFIIEDLDELIETNEIKQLRHGSRYKNVKKMTQNDVKQPRVDEISKYIENDETRQFIMNLIEFIRDKKEFGASVQELKETFAFYSKASLQASLTCLCEIGVILRTGISSIVFVHHDYQSEWLTETFMLTDKEKEIFVSKEKQETKKIKLFIEEKLKSTEPLKVQLKPWTKLDGSLNDELFYQWLCAILSYCVDLPNIPFLAVCDHFQFFKPVDIYSLLEILQELGCIDIVSYSSTRNSLFVSRSIIEEEPATYLDNFEDIFIKPTNVCGIYFGSFLDKNIVEICV